MTLTGITDAVCLVLLTFTLVTNLLLSTLIGGDRDASG